MSYKTILVSLNDVARADRLTAVASALAVKTDAHVIGHYVIPAVMVYPEVGMALVPSVFEGYRNYFMEREAEVRGKFESRIKADGVRGEWRTVDSPYPDIASSLVDHGRNADLIVVSQIKLGSDTNIELDLVARVLMESGRPVLIVPQTWKGEAPGSVIVAGFNGTKEAARNLFDAVPLMQGAREVRLVWVDPYKQRLEAGEVPGAEAAAALARHGITAVAEPMLTDGRNGGEALLMRAHDLGADLVTMGAYAHSRMQQYIFGGATRHVLEHMQVPVLMSH
jgi:nucleotide-binding universal stress UspA family protein